MIFFNKIFSSLGNINKFLFLSLIEKIATLGNLSKLNCTCLLQKLKNGESGGVSALFFMVKDVYVVKLVFEYIMQSLDRFNSFFNCISSFLDSFCSLFCFIIWLNCR